MLPKSPGYCREYFILEVCSPQGLTLPFDLIFNFYILIKNRSNGGGLSGDTRFRQAAGHAPSTVQSCRLRGSHGRRRARARGRPGAFPRTPATCHGREAGSVSAPPQARASDVPGEASYVPQGSVPVRGRVVGSVDHLSGLGVHLCTLAF